jgi:tetratricopeptide (TPR) repeat protein
MSSGLSGLVLIPFLAGGVPRLESPAAQLSHAASCKTAMRGKAGEELETARRAAVEAYRAVREHFAGEARACAEASFRAGELLRATSDTAGAIAEFEIARERGAETPFRARAGLEIGHVHRRGRMHGEALTAYEGVLADAGAKPGHRDDASYWIGHVHEAEGRIEDARRAWKRVAEEGEDPLDRIRSWDCIAHTFVLSGDLEGAAGVVERCREALSEVAAEETRLGERVRGALSTMRVLDELQRAVQEREAKKKN